MIPFLINWQNKQITQKEYVIFENMTNKFDLVDVYRNTADSNYKHNLHF